MKTNSYIPEAWRKQWRKSMEYIYPYLPTKYKANEREWSIRRLIWDFKDGQRSLAVAQVVAERIIRIYGERAKELTFACIPASSQAKNENRYREFSAEVARLAGCANAYEAVTVSGSRLAIHESRNGKRINNTQTIELDAAYFAGRKVLLFDDILTLGNSYARFATAIEAIGATVVGGLFLGKTITI